MLNPVIHAYVTVPAKLPTAVGHEIAGAIKLACLDPKPRVIKEETVQPHLLVDLLGQDIAIIWRVPMRTKELPSGYTIAWMKTVAAKIESEISRILLEHKLNTHVHLETDVVVAKISARYF